VLEKSIKQLNRVSNWISLGLGLRLVLGLGLVWGLVLELVLGLVQSNEFCKVPSSHLHVSQNLHKNCQNVNKSARRLLKMSSNNWKKMNIGRLSAKVANNNRIDRRHCMQEEVGCFMSF